MKPETILNIVLTLCNFSLCLIAGYYSDKFVKAAKEIVEEIKKELQ